MRWTARTTLPIMVAGILSVATMLPQVALADGAWLDDDAATWNEPGMAIPHPLETAWSADPRCDQQLRPAASDEDRAVEAAGWKLYGEEVRFRALRIVRALAGYDGMCRPMEYQMFVFITGRYHQFVGTMSPTPMDSRTDGALNRIEFPESGLLTGHYARYTANDALCCPSAISTVTFRVTQAPRSMVDYSLQRVSTVTEPTSAATPTSPTSPSTPAPVQAPAQIPRSR